MPNSDAYDTYLEPFLGGGAVFYALESEGRLDGKLTVLGDGDPDLITLYAAVRDDTAGLIRDAGRHIAAADSDPENYFKHQQDLWNARVENRTPGRHLYLRRACWNGLWRTSKTEGRFNTPWRKEPPAPLDEQKLLRAAVTLRGVELLDWDFRRYETDESFFVGERTLVYLDPPYLGDAGDFTGYLPTGWGEKDLRELLELCREWTDRGAHVLLSHSNTEETRRLIGEVWSRSTVHLIDARRSINSDGEGRGPVKEVIVVGKPMVDTLHVPLHAVPEHAEVARA